MTTPAPSSIDHEFYGYKMIQNTAMSKLALYVGSANAKDLAEIVSVDNEVKWDETSNIWRDGGRNRTIIKEHYESILEFLEGDERILPSSIVISADPVSFKFEPMTAMPEKNQTKLGIITLTGKYTKDARGNLTPVDEKERGCWVLDGQHRIKAFRDWSSADPYPVNVIIIKAWKGDDYEDAMRHQTYELNMGRELDKNFKASIREEFNGQIGHDKYKREIGLSWIRKKIEGMGDVFSPQIVGAPNLRPGHVIQMHSFEQIIDDAYKHDSYLHKNYDIEDLKLVDVTAIAKYLYNFFEGVRTSIGIINPHVRGTIGTEPAVATAIDYWDIATKTKHKQKLLHGVGLKALVRELLHKVMNESPTPKSPADVAKKLDHMRGIPWCDTTLVGLKDDWVRGLSDALVAMYDPPPRKQKGTKGGKKYQMRIKKEDAKGNILAENVVQCFGWK